MTALHCPRSVPWTTFAGQAVRVGAWWSVTVTVKVQALVRALVSVAVQVTVVTPLTKSVPLAGPQTKVTPGQLSVAVGANVTWAVQAPRSVLTATFAGQVICGSSVSLTVTVKVQLAELLAASVALQVTVVVPLLNAVPLAGAHVTVTGPSQTSLAVGAM
jgi:hypothetical protein